MLRIVIIGMFITISLAGCGDDSTQPTVTKEHSAVGGMSPTLNNVNTQDVKHNDTPPVAIQTQTSETSQAVVSMLENKSLEAKAEHAQPIKVVKKDVVVKEVVQQKTDGVMMKVQEKAKSIVNQVKPVSIVLGDASKGEKLAKRCSACHSFGLKDKTGPHLKGILNRAAGKSGFKKHSTALKSANWLWDEAHLLKWVCDSKTAIKEFTGNPSARTKMPKQKVCGEKAKDLVAYLQGL